jgi:serine/threonine-protein kinase
VQGPNPGEILLGKYRVEEIVGVGGMGRVVKASHLYLQQPVAIKILLPEMADSQSTVARFLREAQATVRLRSEHIARVMDVGAMPDGAPFMVMEFLEGHDLNQILRHHGPQQPQAVVDLMLQACEGMAEAHAMGIIHRDIKPSNFFITRRPDGSNLLKILDFGISKTSAELSELTGTQTVIGTPTYMAPEQMVSARSTDPRSDIWSIGVVMYQLLEGRPPFEAETYAQLVLKVGTAPPAPLHVPLPPGLQDIVFRCLEKDPGRRIQSVGELARMLAPYASDPMSAAQAAERAARILTAPKGGHAGTALPGGAAGGLSMTPPQLTPKSWSKTGGSSLSGGAGQMSTGTKVMRAGRGTVIAGVATLVVVAGIGGFFIAGAMKGSKSEPKVQAPVEVKQEMKVMATEPAAPKVDAVSGAPATGSAAKNEAHADGTKTAKADAHTAKSDATKADAHASAAKDTTKSDAAKTDAHASATTKSDTHASTTKSDATKTDTAKTDTAKSDAATGDAAKSTKSSSSKSMKTSTSGTKSTKSSSTKSTKTETKTDDLFDDRK